jgi:hypothetical protein
MRGNTMNAKIALFVLNFALSQLKKHPALVDKVLGELSKRIPGSVDDALFAALAQLIK